MDFSELNASLGQGPVESKPDTKLEHYRVSLGWRGENVLFECQATDKFHAIEQAEDAYKGCKVMGVWLVLPSSPDRSDVTIIPIPLEETRPTWATSVVPTTVPDPVFFDTDPMTFSLCARADIGKRRQALHKCGTLKQVYRSKGRGRKCRAKFVRR